MVEIAISFHEQDYSTSFAFISWLYWQWKRRLFQIKWNSRSVPVSLPKFDKSTHLSDNLYPASLPCIGPDQRSLRVAHQDQYSCFRLERKKKVTVNWHIFLGKRDTVTLTHFQDWYVIFHSCNRLRDPFVSIRFEPSPNSRPKLIQQDSNSCWLLPNQF